MSALTSESTSVTPPLPVTYEITDHVGARETLSQTLSMAWRATKKMRRNPEQFFDVLIQPLLFTAMFAYIFGGAISGGVSAYLPIIIPGILAQTTLTACIATGIQLREDMDKGVFDRFKSLPIARIAPLAGPASGAMRAMGSDLNRSKTPLSMSSRSWMPVAMHAVSVVWARIPGMISGR